MGKYILSSYPRKTAWIMLVIYLWFCPSVFAAVIRLNSGEMIDREITYRDEEMIKIDTGYGIDLTYYYDEIESIDGHPPTPVEEPVEADTPLIEATEPAEDIGIVKGLMDDRSLIHAEEPIEDDTSIREADPDENADTVTTKEPVEYVEDDGTVETLEPFSIGESFEEVEMTKTEKPVTASEPIKDISVIEEQTRIKELPSPFGPTIRENETRASNATVPAVRKSDEPLPESQIMNDLQGSEATVKGSITGEKIVIGEQSVKEQKSGFTVIKIRINEQLRFIKTKLDQIPVKIRKDIFVVLSLVIVFFYAIICFPFMLIAGKLDRKKTWLVWIPVVQVIYFVYIAKKPFLWSILFLIPIVNILFLLVLFMSVIRELKKSRWWAFLMLLPGINIFILWYLALSSVKQDQEELNYETI